MKRFLLLFGLSAMSAFAQNEPSEETLKAAEEMTVVMGLEKQSVTPMMPLIEGMARKMQLNEADTQELKEIYQAWFGQDLDQAKLRKAVVRLYAENFTVDELKEIAAFYKTPVGQKMLASAPVITQKSSQAGMEEAKAKQPLLQQRLAPFMQKHMPAGAPGSPFPGPAPAPVEKH